MTFGNKLNDDISSQSEYL